MITSNDNERLKLIRKLRDRKWREREGMFATEGEDLLAAGIDAGWAPIAVLVGAGRAGSKGSRSSPHLLDGVSTLGSGTRAIAVWRIPAEPLESGPAVYLHGVGDPGNVGTIVRTAAALTGARVVLGAGSADPYSPKAVRASMGAIFGIAAGTGKGGGHERPADRPRRPRRRRPRRGDRRRRRHRRPSASGPSARVCPRSSSTPARRPRRFRCSRAPNPSTSRPPLRSRCSGYLRPARGPASGALTTDA